MSRAGEPGDAPLAARRRVGVISLGCAKNLVDTEVMLGHLATAGWEFVQDPADADVIVVNTCSFIEPAREESIRTILEAAELKKTGRLKRLVVAGCMVQRYPEDLKREMPEVDAFLGLDELHLIVDSSECDGRVDDNAAVSPGAPPSDLPLVSSSVPLSGTSAGKSHAPDRTARDTALPAVSWSASTYLYDDTTPRTLATPGWTAYVKIAEGCDHTCSFCAIPSFRGGFRSRTPQSIVREATELAAAGVREINLIAQDSSHYGRDLGMSDGLSELLERLDLVEDLRWIRVHYLYPNTITDKLVRTMASAKRVVPYVDLPLQHAHPAMLKRMRRGGSADSHRRLLSKMRDTIPGVALRSTFIVGFPGETDEEFEDLIEFIRDVRFDHLGVFTYSHEEGTTALQMDDDVPADLKRSRRERLMQVQQEIVFERNAGRIGQMEEVLVEGAHPDTDHLLVGRTSRQAPDVDGQILINEGTARPGEFVRVRLTDTAGYDLVGGIVGAS